MPSSLLLLKRWLNVLSVKSTTNENKNVESQKSKEKDLPKELSEISDILGNRLFLSGCRVATKENLAALGVTAVVRALTVSEERIFFESSAGQTDLSPEIKSTYVRLSDQESADIQSHFERVCQFIDTELKSGGKVLVHCGAGVSRSCALVLAYLIRHQNYHLNAAYALVKKQRKIVRPNNGFFRQLIEYERENREDGRSSVRMILTSKGQSMPDIVFENALMAKLR